MAQYIDREALITEIVGRRDAALMRQRNLEAIGQVTVLDEMVANQLNRILSFINNLEVKEVQDEPVSEDLEEAADVYSKVFSDIAASYIRKDAFIAGAKWQKQQDLTPSTKLSNFIDKLSKQFPEVSFAKLSRIAVRVAKWQQQQEYTCYEEAFEDGAKWKAEQFEEERLKHCDELTEEQAQIETDFITQHLKDNNRIPTFIDAIEYGMQTMKEQLLSKSIDGVIAFDYYGNDNKTYGCIAHDSFCLEDFGLKDNDNVKMIIIK